MEYMMKPVKAFKIKTKDENRPFDPFDEGYVGAGGCNICGVNVIDNFIEHVGDVCAKCFKDTNVHQPPLNPLNFYDAPPLQPVPIPAKRKLTTRKGVKIKLEMPTWATQATTFKI
jgi:hypothetical protein